MLTRRSLIATAGAGAMVPLARQPLHAAAHEGAPSLPAALRFPMGDMHVTALNDGALRIGPEALMNIDAEGYAEAMRAQFRDPETFRAPVNAFLIESGETKMLVDVGTGGFMGPDLGRVMDNLKATGTAPEDIALILATHLHPDHVGGAVEDGNALFPNAELAVPEADRAFWSDDSKSSEESAQMFQLAQSVLSAYGDRLKPFEGESEVAPGITSMPLPGHTPGHSGFALSSGDASLLIWADIVHVGPVQFAQPQVTIGFDVNPEQAAETRAAIFDRVVADRMFVAGSHIDFPGLGHVMQAGDGFALIPAPYPYGG